MKPCPNCSMPADNHATTCDKCGWKAAEESTQVNNSPSITPEQSARKQKQERVFEMTIIVIIYGGCALIGGLIGWSADGFVGALFGTACGAYLGPTLASRLI